jgi:hypothetical protein
MADDFLTHWKKHQFDNFPACGTHFFIHITPHPALVTCPACIEQIKYEQEKQDNAKKRL